MTEPAADGGGCEAGDDDPRGALPERGVPAGDWGVVVGAAGSGRGDMAINTGTEQSATGRADWRIYGERKRIRVQNIPRETRAPERQRVGVSGRPMRGQRRRPHFSLEPGQARPSRLLQCNCTCHAPRSRGKKEPGNPIALSRSHNWPCCAHVRPGAADGRRCPGRYRGYCGPGGREQWAKNAVFSGYERQKEPAGDSSVPVHRRLPWNSTHRADRGIRLSSHPVSQNARGGLSKSARSPATPADRRHSSPRTLLACQEPPSASRPDRNPPAQRSPPLARSFLRSPRHPSIHPHR